MRRVLLTLVIIILASSIYIGYNWATTEDDDRGKASNMPETVQNGSNDEKNDNNHNENIQANSMTYEEYWNNLLEEFNEETHLLFNENNIHIIGFLHSTTLYSMNGQQMETTVTSHSYYFDELSEVEKDSFYDFHEYQEDYELNTDIKGMITYDESSKKYSFYQTNGTREQSPILIRSRSSESVDDLKKVLDELEAPKVKEYNEEAFMDLIGMDMSHLLAFQLDDPAINLDGIDLLKYEGETELTIYYEIDIDGELDYTSINIKEASDFENHGEAIELNNGLTIYLIDKAKSIYGFTENDYDYLVTFFDDKSNNLAEKESILELLNVPLLKK